MVLVYTDECARDIDTPDVAMVVKFNMPRLIDDYVHRICRAGCSGNKGSATSFVRTFLLTRARKYHHSSMTLPGMGNGDYVSRYQDRWTRKGRTTIGILQGMGTWLVVTRPAAGHPSSVLSRAFHQSKFAILAICLHTLADCVL